MELRDKLRDLLKEEHEYMRTIVPWDGMFDNTVNKIIKLVTDDVMNADIDLEVSAEYHMMKDREKIWSDKKGV